MTGIEPFISFPTGVQDAKILSSWGEKISSQARLVGPPPTDRGDADLSYVESVAREISGAINEHKEGYKVIVEKSTVPVYTSAWVRKVMLRNGADPDSFDVASNPEFLREGTAVTDF